MRRWQMVTAGLTGIVLATGLALGGATSASAAPAGHWGAFTLSGTGKAYTGTMSMPGFPATTFTSNSRQSTVISGASTWQSAATGPGALYGSSRGNTYMNQRPNADSPNASSASVTTYTFADPTPAGSWSFVLGDVDADQATISATVQGGQPGAATAAQLGFQGAYNSCSAAVAGGWTCPPDPDGSTGKDVPTWDAATRTLTGNAAANDTAGATAWFTPTTPLTSLTITYQQRSGFPVYQTWFASRTAAIAGTATLDGTPLPGSTVTVTAPRGTTYTTTTDAEGNYAFPNLPQINGYTVEVTPPAGAAPLDQSATVSLIGADGTADRAFTAPTGTVSVIGTVVDDAGNPAANVPVVITDPNNPDDPLSTTTNSDGVYTGSGLTPDTDVSVTVDGADPVVIRTGAEGAAPVEPEPITVPADAVVAITGTVTLDGAAVPAGTVVDLLDADGNVLVSTTTAAGGTYRIETVPGAYTVRVAVPPGGATGGEPVTVDTTSGPATADFAFATPVAPVPQTVDQPGTVTDTNGAPVSGVDVVATPTDPEAGAPVTTTTGADGGFTLPGLQPETEYTIVVDGGDPQTITTPATGAGTPLVFVVPAAATPTPTPTPTPTVPPTSGGGSGTTPVSSTGGSSSTGALAYTGADLTPGLIAAGVLVLLGAGLLTFRAARNRRRSEHLQD